MDRRRFTQTSITALGLLGAAGKNLLAETTPSDSGTTAEQLPEHLRHYLEMDAEEAKELLIETLLTEHENALASTRTDAKAVDEIAKAKEVGNSEAPSKTSSHGPGFSKGTPNTKFVPITARGTSKNHHLKRRRCGCSDGSACSTKQHGYSWVDLFYLPKEGQTQTKYDARLSLWRVHGLEVWNKNGVGTGWAEMERSKGAFMAMQTGWQWDGIHPNGGILARNWVTANKTLGGTIAIEFRVRHSHESVGIWLYEPDFPYFGRDWFHCGKDIRIEIRDA